MTDINEEIFDIWCRTHPTDAYNAGIGKYVGKAFIPDDGSVDAALMEIEGLMEGETDASRSGILACMKRELMFEEPYMYPDQLLWQYYGYMVREGVVPEHLGDLMRAHSEGLEHVKARMYARDWPVEIKVLVNNNTRGAIGMIEALIEQNAALEDAGRPLVDGLREYLEHFSHPGVERGNFDEVFPILECSGGDIGRADIYPLICRDMYDYTETVDEIEQKGLAWLREELSDLLSSVSSLAESYGCEATAEAVRMEMDRRRAVPVSGAVAFVNRARDVLVKVVEKHLCRITPNYDTRVVETPDYLVNLIPTAAMSTFDGFSDHPFNVFFVTTSDRVSPALSVPGLLQTLIHEEYGHCVNFSNSSTRFAAEPTLPELIHTTLSLPISDGISFNREREAQDLLLRLFSAPGAAFGPEEEALGAFLEEQGDLPLLLREMEFVVRQWRVVRFLRAIGDVRINMHRQSITEFVNWAHEETSLSRKQVFDQIFIFQGMVGYAPCYSMAGQRIRATQQGLGEGDILKFNTYISSLGFPPRSVFEERYDRFRG